ALYAGALWMGGISPDQQLKLAAVTFRADGNDFWTGPLTNDGSAEIDEATCELWDRFSVVERQDAAQHRRYFDCLNDPLCDVEIEFPDGYSTPSYFYTYPAHGNTALNQDYYLSPFFDYDLDGNYDPNAGDYPWYFLSDNEVNCDERRREDPIPLFGDQTYYWIFNDKGNVHSESQGEPIGMEIRAQAFAFSSTDEINNMTFYNYVMINQGTQTLGQTYFGTWVDADVGTSVDDYVGCDVQRGLGYAYNGDAFDEPSTSSLGYGENPPAIGVDFFEGPYQDADDFDNPLTTDFSEAVDGLGIPYEGIGIGYGDGVADNERFGMRRFVYYNNGTNPINGEPTTPVHFYNYMNGIWKNNQKMAYGGDGVNPNTGANLDIEADYMFPGSTDPFNWGTGGENVDPWNEVIAGNPPGDRRFIQAAGPFTLQPGDYNNITVGVVYSENPGGGPDAALAPLRIADDKAQALFDNCFQIVSGPDAPEVTYQELDQEVILYLSNDNPLSNNYLENYIAFDPNITRLLDDGTELDSLQRSYTFQGYQIYQTASATVSPSQLSDVEVSRLVATVDVKDSVDVVVNYVLDQTMELPVPVLAANGPNEGIRHSFKITSDAFAQGDSRLVNHKTYYFIVVAYGYNNYQDYNPVLRSGQAEQYKVSRRSGTGGAIRAVAVIPHKPTVENGGTVSNAAYGDGVQLTRLEGRGNGNNDMLLTAASEREILENVYVDEVTYEAGRGPVNIQVVDPLNVPSADFELRLAPDDADIEEADTAFWQITNLTMLLDADPDNDIQAVKTSNKAINILNEELLLDWGLSITWEQYFYPNNGDFTELISSEIEFKDSSRPWFQGVPDQEGFTELNWIRAGTQESDPENEAEVVFDDLKPGAPLDETEEYEGVLGGTWAPYCLVSYTDEVTPLGATESVLMPMVAPTIEDLSGDISLNSNVSGLNNVDVVLTSDKSLWTRVPVLEMQANVDLAQDADGNDDIDPEKMRLRRHPSVDKNGLWNSSQPGYNEGEATLNGTQPIGMGWFPGYAIDLGTGERLNMAFGEDSWLGADNGKDMIWNPSSRITSNLGSTVYAGGQHWIYVFKNNQREEGNDTRMPAYDEGAYAYSALESDFSATQQRRVFRACTWVGSALVNDDFPLLPVSEGLIPNECRIKLRVNKPYAKYSPSQIDAEEYGNDQNFWNPFYTFSTRGVATQVNSNPTLVDVLDEINVVPNPYYAYSQYETSKLDNRVKITNLPEECTVTIYNISGTLVRQYRKADPLTSLDWDLKNERNIPIAGGVYIIHVEVPGAGEKVLKWFGIMRPADLDNF
ncbi:MAG: T9SS C-terminal target domain-containing protein, partial [Flavobacteriales bacterium]|nr:T9SS C-terminal target domain-containing protein [Flavobacteriales bacterium]